MKISEISTIVTEDESNKSDENIFRAMKTLESWFNPQATKAIDDYNRERDIMSEQVNLALFTAAMIKEPTNYEEALNVKKKEDQIAWKEAINKQLNEMIKRGVWEIIDEKNSK